MARERLDMGPGYIIEPGQPFDPVLFSMTDLQAELWWSAAILDVAPPVPPAVDPATPEPVVAEPTPQARPSKRR